MNIWNETMKRYSYRCVICQMYETEGAKLRVVSITLEIPVRWETDDPTLFVPMCSPCELDVTCYVSGQGFAKTGVIKKYLRERGRIVQEVDARRKKATGRKD